MKYLIILILSLLTIVILMGNVPIGSKVLNFRSVTSEYIPMNTDYVIKNLTEELTGKRFVIHENTLYLKVYEKTPYLLGTSIKTFDWSEYELKQLTLEHVNLFKYFPSTDKNCMGIEWSCENKIKKELKGSKPF